MKNLMRLLLVGSIFGCSHANRDFEEKISSQQCDEALKIQSDPLLKAEKSAIHVANNIAAYTYITANYTAEVLWDITAGTVAIIVLSAPTIAISMASSNYPNGSGRGQIAPAWTGSTASINNIFSPPLGKRARTKTQNMRCPDLAGMSRVIGRVVSCYERKGDPESLKKAVTSLENIEMSSNFFTCLPPSEQMAISARRLALQSR